MSNTPESSSVSPLAFLSELEKHMGNAEAALQKLETDPAPVYEHREADPEFRDQWDRIVHSFTDEAQASFLAAYRRSHKVVLAAREAGIPRELVYRLRQSELFFQHEWARIEDAWERKLGRPGGDPDRNTDADVEVIHHRLKDPAASKVVAIYRAALAWPEETIPRSALQTKLGIPPTSVQKDYDARAPRGGRKGAQSAGERVEFSREFLIELLVYRYAPGSDARRAPRKKAKKTS